MKYLHHKTLGLVLFEPRIGHADFAEAIGLKRDEIVSAGFVGARDRRGVCCHGESHTLNRASSDDDTLRLQAWLGVTPQPKG